MDRHMVEHLINLIDATPIKSLLDCQITLREIRRIAEVDRLYEELTSNDKVQEN